MPIKTVENVTETTEASVREEEDTVKTKVKAGTPIKKVQAEVKEGDKPPIRTKIYTPEEISKLTGQPVEQIKAAQAKKKRTYDDVQKDIDTLEDQLEKEGRGKEEPEKLKALYKERNAIGQRELKQSYREVKNIVKSTGVDNEVADYIVRKIYDIDPSSPTGQYMAGKYTKNIARNLDNITTKKIAQHLINEYGKKHNLDMEMVIGSNLSAWSRDKQMDFMNDIKDKAENISKKVYFLLLS